MGSGEAVEHFEQDVLDRREHADGQGSNVAAILAATDGVE
jgi:hypothetical protein